MRCIFMFRFGKDLKGVDENASRLRDSVSSVARRIMSEQGIADELRLDVSLGEDGLGLDSMGRLELLRAVEQELHVTIPEAYWGSKRFKNLDDLIRVISRS